MDSFVHYTDIGKNCLDINCDNCGYHFEYGKSTPSFCPSCGARLVEEKFNHIPMKIIPNGMKAFLYQDYDRYNREYYNNTDNWREITQYLKIIYNPTKIDSLLNESMNGIKGVAKGYALRNKKELCFVSEDGSFIGFYIGEERTKENIKVYSIDEFKKELLKLAAKTKK